MGRIAVTCASAALALCSSGIALADAHADLTETQAASLGAESWHAKEPPANGPRPSINFSVPDRWRLRPSPAITDPSKGDDIRTMPDANAIKRPAVGELSGTSIKSVAFPVRDPTEGSAHDLGTRTLDGQIVHAYSFAAHGVPVTLYLRGNSQPVHGVEDEARGTAVTGCSIIHASIAIAAP